VPDLVRVGLFLVSASAVLGSSLVLVSALRLTGSATILALWIVTAAQIVLVAQALSIANALDWPGFLLGHLAIAAGALIWSRRWPSAERCRAVAEIRAGLGRLADVAWDRRAPALAILATPTLLAGLIGAALAVWVPPNDWDSVVYHMSRVGYYLQFRSLDHYPTSNIHQVLYPANAEILILWTVAFLRSARLANTIELAAWVVATVAVYGLGRQIGLGARAALFGAGAFALLPQSILLSTTTKNDLVLTSFLAVSVFFLFDASRRPGASDSPPGAPGVWAGQPAPSSARAWEACRGLILAGAALGLAIGTKGTAVLALPGLAVVGLVLFARQLERRVVAGVLLGGGATVLLGAYMYVQNWYLYGSPSGSPVMAYVYVPIRWDVFLANLARNLYGYVFADLSGPLANPLAAPLADPLSHAFATLGEWLFTALGIPAVVEGADDRFWPQFSFLRRPRVHVFFSGIGPIGAAILTCAVAALIWPRRSRVEYRLLAFAALSYIIAVSLVLKFNPHGVGRFLIVAAVFAAPLLGLAIRNGAGSMALAILLAVVSSATGLYTATFNEDKPLASVIGQDRLGLMVVNNPLWQEFQREIDGELGPRATVGVYGSVRDPRGSSAWEFPLFGPRFDRWLVPLAEPAHVRLLGLRRPLDLTREGLLAAHPVTHVLVQGPRSGAQTLPSIIPGQCFELPLRYGKPRLPWELWRCDDRDPRSLVQNGDFGAWSETRNEDRGTGNDRTAPQRLPEGWIVAAEGDARIQVQGVEPVAPGEPFRLRLDAQAATNRGGIVQTLPIEEGLRGAILIVDARVRADVAGAAILRVNDGVASSAAANQTTEPETLRIRHRLDQRATRIQVALGSGSAEQDTVVLVRSVLAIPH
jgi:4-amino-4-deoxy-L-arabinose transferase-like glycosyltransferase